MREKEHAEVKPERILYGSLASNQEAKFLLEGGIENADAMHQVSHDQMNTSAARMRRISNDKIIVEHSLMLSKHG